MPKLRRIAAIAYAIITAGIVAFQLALAAGAPLGAYAMGGAYPGTFPPALRVAAVVQGALLAVFALVVLARAEVAMPRLERVSRIGIWVVVGMSCVSLVLNTITSSAGERAIWAPVALVMVASSLAVAVLSRRASTRP
ncbi:MAG TPA: hypothetical protein VFG89_05540 [Coriobacteriia bacterium]|nr:hypothetical protein [Coriobacteriia bacterium]